MDDLNQLGGGRIAPESGATLYRRAFAEFGVHALWSRSPSSQTSPRR